MGPNYQTMSDGCKVYVGNLTNSIDERDMQDCFGKFGSIRNVWIARNPPGFAFVTFEDPKDAEDCVKDMDGQELDRERLTDAGQRCRVEVSHGRSKGSGGDRGGGGGDRGGDRGGGDRGGDRRGGGDRRSPPRRDDRDRGYDRRDDRGRDRSRSRSGGRRERSPRRSRSRSR